MAHSYQGNLLDAYDQSTYHLKLFMLPEYKFVNDRSTSSSVNKYNSDDGIIIAETGVTSKIFFDEVSFESFIALDKMTRNANAVKFDITLKEFSGVSLVDSMFAASIELGIQNYTTAPYFLELSFRGRDPDTGAEVVMSDMTWVWPIQITKIDTEVTIGGASYTLLAYHQSHLAQQKPFGIIDKAIKFEAKDVKEAVNLLSEHLTERGTEKAVTTYSLPDRYVIDFGDPTDDTDVKTTLTNTLGDLAFKTGVTSEPGKSRSTKSDTVAHPLATEISIESKKSIIDAINTILTSTDKYQEMIKQSDDSNSQAKDGKKMKMIHKVVTNAKIIGYDVARGDYQREYTYSIIPYQMGTLNTSPSETKGDDSTEKVSEYKSKGLLQKEYSYMFTGVNDQVLEFDMKFAFGWYVNMPSQGGLYTQSYASNESQHFDKAFVIYRNLREMIMASVQNMHKGETGADRAKSSAELSAKIQAADLPEEQKVQLEKLNRVQSRERLPDSEKESYSKSLTPRSQSTSSSVKKSSPSNRYVSDYNRTEAISTADVETRFRLLPTRYLEDSSFKDDDNAQSNVEGRTSGGREQTNAIFTQALSGTSSDLVTMNMTIKGDPYWLGPSNAKVPVPFNGNTGQIFFKFILRSPEIPDESTGIVTTRTTAATGIYAVNKITHTFSGGKYTSEMECIRNIHVDMTTLKE